MSDALDSELDDNVTGMLDRAATGGTPDPDAAIAALRDNTVSQPVKQPSVSGSESVRPKSTRRRTRAELEAALSDMETAMESVREAQQANAGVNKEQAIADLGATIAFAVSIAGRWVAASRQAPHWLFEPDEAKNIGEAWAVVAAPYAEQLKEFIPLGLALAVTWKSVEPRLEADKVLAAQHVPVTDARTTNATD